MYDETMPAQGMPAQAMPAQTVAAGWYADPQVAGTMRYWDGSAWSEHTASGYGAAAPAGAGTPAQAFSPFQPQYQPQAAPRKLTFMEANRQSMIALGFGVGYLVVAQLVGIVFFGIIPVMAASRAISRKEPMAPIAMVVAVISAILGVLALVH